MNRDLLFETIGDVDDAFIIESDTITSAKRRWLKPVSIAACLALMLLTGAVGYVYTTGTLPSAQAATPFVRPDKQPAFYAVTYPDEKDRIIVTHANRYILARYARAPYPGECRFDMFGPVVMDEYYKTVDSDTVYWVEISLYDQDGHLIQAGDEKHKEAKRLATLGYEIYLSDIDWTGYWGEQKHYTYLCGYFTAEHLRYFPVSEQFGYSIDFVRQDSRMGDAVFERVIP